MGSVHLILGRTRARRRRAVAHAFTGVDRLGRPDFLYITDTVRKKHIVEREFVGYRGGTTFPPEVMTLSELLARLIARHGDGRGTWERGSVALIAERMIGPGWPWLVALGDPARVGADVAALHADWDEAGQPRLEDRPELDRFLRQLTRRLEEDPVRTTMGAALRRLVHTLREPPEGLAAWMLLWPRVSLDDILHPSPIRREVVVQLARAWATLGTHVTIGLESGRDLGGAEAGRFFEYDDTAEEAFSLRAFVATRSFRRDLFRGLVEEGGEAAILLATEQGGVEIDPGAEPWEPEPADVTDAMFLPAGSVQEVKAERLHLRRWPDAATEVRGIAHEVKEALLGGEKLENVVVAFPALTRYAPLVRRIFGELGIPVSLSSGTPAMEHPIALVLLEAIALPARGWPVQPLVAILAHDLVHGVDGVAALKYGRACREAGQHAGVPVGQSGPAHDALLRAHEQLRAFAAPIPAGEWFAAILALVEAWRLLDRAREVEDPADRAGALQAIGAVVTAAREVADRATAVDAGSWEPARLAKLLREAVFSARLPDAEAGVAVIGMLELRGYDPKQLWIGGLVADDFPGASPEDYLLGRRERRILDRLEPVDEGRYLLASSIRNTIHGSGAIRLSWPIAAEGKPVAVSPLVEDLLAVEIDGEALRKRVTSPRVVGELGPGEVATKVGAQLGVGGEAEGWDAGVEAHAHRLAATTARRDPTGFGAWDGVLDRPPPLPASLSVTGLERFLGCPIRHLLGRVLGLESESAYDPDLDAAARGTLIHAILQAFDERLRNEGLRTLAGIDEATFARCATWLDEAARPALDAAPEIRSLRPALREWHKQRWLAGLVAKEPAGLLAAWLRHEVDGPPATRISAEQEFKGFPYGPLRISGRVDRVDRLPGSTLVIDYKTGKAPPADAVRAGVRVQGLIYVDAVAGDEPGAAVYLELRKANAIIRSGWVGDEAAITEADGDLKKGVVLDEELGAALRQNLVDAGERMAAGRFHPSLAGPTLAGCDWCELKRACRVDHERNERIAGLHDPLWQAPLGAKLRGEDE